MSFRMAVGGVAAGLLLPMIGGPAPLDAQGPDGRWPLQPRSSIDRVVAPFLEGWYDNGDGTVTFSFGYNNLNADTVWLPIGERNYMEPAEFDGGQPTMFLPGKHRGLFAITVPEEQRDVHIWWNLRNPNGEVTRVPGRISTGVAYQLDWFPRPHGTVPPRVSFEGGDEGYGPPGIMSQRTFSARVGEPLALSVTTREISERDDEDFRFRETLALRVVWYLHQGPEGARIEWTRHESTPPPDVPEGRGGRGGDPPEPPGPEEVMLGEPGDGDAYVYATFSMPGEYIILAQVDNFRAPDSSSGNQCCWTNGYVRVSVQ